MFVDMRRTGRSIFRKGFVCENCRSLERHCLIFAFLKDRALLSGNLRILHLGDLLQFAVERHLAVCRN